MGAPHAAAPLWIDLDGAENVRDVAGLPTADGRRVRPGRLIRADSLQELSAADVRHLVDVVGVRAVADLRTGVEVDSEGPGPMTREAAVSVTHLSLFPEWGDRTDAGAPQDGPVILPWQQRDAAENDTAKDDAARRRSSASEVYLRYLDERADSILAALRMIAHTDGATIVHCAAGKDRTGTVVALALAEVGVLPDAIVEDYARSGERIERIYARLGRRRTYASDLEDAGPEQIDRHRPRAETMRGLLDAIDEVHGGGPAWLRANGWSADDAAALRRSLLGDEAG